MAPPPTDLSGAALGGEAGVPNRKPSDRPPKPGGPSVRHQSDDDTQVLAGHEPGLDARPGQGPEPFRPPFERESVAVARGLEVTRKGAD